MSKTIIVISDTHLGNRRFEDCTALKEFVAGLRGDEIIVLLGDIMDFFSEMPNTDILERFLSIFLRIPNKVIYIAGNHDIIAENFFNFENITFRTSYEKVVGKKRYLFMHGWEFEAGIELEIPYWLYRQLSILGCWLKGKWAKLIWRLYLLKNLFGRWSLAVKMLRWAPRERIFRKIRQITEDPILRKIMFGIGRNTHLVYGHTHLAYIGAFSSNAGEWSKKKHNRLIIDRKGIRLE